MPARGGAEVALGLYFTFVIYRTCMRLGPAKAVRAFWELVATMLKCNSKRTLSSRFTVHASCFALHSSYVALHTPHLISAHLFSHVIQVIFSTVVILSEHCSTFSSHQSSSESIRKFLLAERSLVFDKNNFFLVLTSPTYV